MKNSHSKSNRTRLQLCKSETQRDVFYLQTNLRRQIATHCLPVKPKLDKENLVKRLKSSEAIMRSCLFLSVTKQDAYQIDSWKFSTRCPGVTLTFRLVT